MINGGNREQGASAPGTMIFRADEDVVVRSPEELAKIRIFVHPAYMDQIWGPGSAERYRQTQREIAKQASFPNQGSIHFK